MVFVCLLVVLGGPVTFQALGVQDVQPETPDALPALAQDEVFIELTDGSRFEAILISQDDQTVVVTIGNIRQTYPASKVVRIVALPSVRERYVDLRKNIPDDDADQLFVLARWLRSRGELLLALLEIDHVLTLDSGHPEALRFRRLVEAEVALKIGQGKGEPRSKPKNRDGFPTLTRDEINLIKVYEIDLARPPSLELEDGLIDRLLERYGDDPLMPKTPEGIEALKRQPPRRVLNLLFRLKARDLYSQVEVRGHPKAMLKFKGDVHAKWLLRSCATTKCHGGAEAGRLWLRTRAKGSDATVYTNFLILDRFRLADGSPLIDYLNPAQSPLLQMGLAVDRSEHPHPELPRTAGIWRPPMTGPEDPKFKDAVDWLRSMYLPRPEYPIEYTPPPTPADQMHEDLLIPAPAGPR